MFQKVLLLLCLVLGFGSVSTVEIVETNPQNCPSEIGDGTCENDDVAASTKIENTNPLAFLKERVFGQKDAEPSEKFLSMLEDDDYDHPPKTKNKDDNPFSGILDRLGKLPFLVDNAKQQSQKEIDRMESTKLVKEILKQTAVTRQQDMSVQGLEMLNRITTALQQAGEQLHRNFGDLMDSMDGYILFSIFYYLQHQAAHYNSMWKRRVHRFYNTVSKDEFIQLHDALYLSNLAYADTVEHFREGLAKFNDNELELMYGTTQSLPNLPANFLLIHKELAPLEQPLFEGFFYGKKETEVVVVMVVRGTKDLSDALSDALLEPKEYQGGYAHGGILASGKNLAKYYLPKLQELHRASGRDKVRLICVGHSLGAGAGAIAAMELQHHDFLKVEAVGFGCPSLISRDLAESTKNYITTVVNDADIIPRMSGSSMANLLLDLIEYDWIDDALDDINFTIQRAKNISSIGNLLPDSQSVLSWVKGHLEKQVMPKFENHTKRDRKESLLIPPGTCLHTYRDGYGFSATYIPCDFFATIEFSLTLIDDHLIPTGYQRGMLGVVQDKDRDYSFQFRNDPNTIVGVT